jgi:hypothetical protein
MILVMPSIRDSVGVPPPQPFRFEELGSLQFERLCRELMRLEHGIDPREWTGDALLLPDGIRGLAGPTLVVVAWGREEDGRVLDLVSNAVYDWSSAGFRSLLLLTNADEMAAADAIVGPAELAAALLRSPQLRLRVPSVLGICDVADLVDRDVLACSSGDVDAAAQLARVFVPTRAYDQALDVLQRHRFAVLTGPPEMGKTANARMLALALLTEGWELHECTRPDELWALYARDRRQVFIADDAFGSTEYRPEAAERWAVELDRVLRAMDDRHRLLWTSRPAPLNAGLRRIHREHGVERFPQPAQVEVDASALDVTEKALILFRHAKSRDLDRRARTLVRRHGWDIVSHTHFTPERIRRFVDTRLVDLAAGVWPEEVGEVVASEIREPTAAMAASFRALAPEHRAVLVALLDAPPPPVAERELSAAVRRHSATFARPPREVVDRLADHFLRVGAAGVTWVHPSWRDLVIEELAADPAARRTFLRASGIDGVSLALSTGGGAAGERVLPLLLDDADWDALADRLAELVPELEEPDAARLLAALGEARVAVTPPAQAELDALTAYALELLTRRPLPVELLEAWFELESAFPEKLPRRPDFAPAWFELVPAAPVDVDSQPAVARFDDWTSLAAVLERWAPESLNVLGFARQERTIRRFVEAALALGLRGGDPPPHRDVLVRILRRLAAIAPAAARGATQAVSLLLEAAPAPELPPVEYRELSPELERLLDAPTLVGVPSDRTLVARVLRDL